MERRDSRQLSQSAQEELRQRAIRMIERGVTQREVAKLLEVNPTTVSGWWRRFQKGGMVSLKKRPRGFAPGTRRRLSEEQERELSRLLVDHVPDQLELEYALWSREAVRQLILQRYQVSYALQTISVLLARLGFTSQRPAKRAYEQNAECVSNWLKDTYPKLEEQAKSENAEIYWADETAVKPEAYLRRGYSPKGKTPVVFQPAKRFHSSVISAVNKGGKMEWMALMEALNAQSFIVFLEQLIKLRTRKVFLVVDNLRVHHSKLVKAWAEDKKERIELVYLPPYSPELNPDEYLNQRIKQEVAKEPPAKTKPELDAKLKAVMIRLQVRESGIAACFQHPCVQYAA